MISVTTRGPGRGVIKDDFRRAPRIVLRLRRFRGPIYLCGTKGGLLQKVVGGGDGEE